MPPELIASPQLPQWALYPAVAALTLLSIVVLARTKGVYARFLLAALWLRYVMSAFHEVTYQPLIAGQSWNAIATAAVFLFGAALTPTRHWRLWAMAPVYLLIGVTIISGFANAELAGAANTLLKWGYFSVLMLCAYEASRDRSTAQIAGLLLWAFAPPLCLQALSLALGVSKATDDGGAISFIGGYDHEAAFSIVLLTGLAFVSLATRLPAILRLPLIAAFAAGLVLANYRTSWIAAAPIVLTLLTVGTTRLFRAPERLTVGLAACVVAVCVLGVSGWLLRSRLGDFDAVFADMRLFQPPDEFTFAEQRLFSSRLYLASQYVSAFLNADVLHQIIGFGPESWRERFATYAHNTPISFLYEFGLLGVVSLALLWCNMLALAMRAGGDRALLVAAHLSFILLNLATMGVWLVEGLAFYALICAFAVSRETYRLPASRRHEIFATAKPS